MKRNSNSVKNARKSLVPRHRQSENLSFSMELKPQANDGTIKSQHHSLVMRKEEKAKQSRSNSAKISTHHNSLIYQMNNSWYEKKNMDSYDIKWIGVHKNNKDEDSSHYQAFPNRKHRTVDQCFGNFVMKYGRQFKIPKQTKSPLIFNDPTELFVTNAATIKVKPRLTWFDKRKVNGREKEGSNNCKKNNLEVCWVRSK